jgi:cytochrome bd ubiquinol oxidase subunit II
VIPFWFILITVLWVGYFVLEGFDFGVGILHGLVGRNEASSRAAINTVGPLWDGNEVWLVVAAAAMFAAFPAWYATMFSGFYLVVVLLLVALIVRGVSFEYRSKRDSPRWRATWDGLLVAGSIAAPFLIGLSLANLLHGVPINGKQEFTGTMAGLFHPYAVYAGLTLVLVCVLHGATFLALKTSGDVRQRSLRLARRAAPVVALVVLGFAAWTHVTAGLGVLLSPVEFAAVVAAFAAVWFSYDGHEGWAFTATTVTMAMSVLSVFVDLYPRVMVSTTSPAFDLTAHNTASGSYTLSAMTIVAVIALPFVLGYQAWTYYVFRKRLTADSFKPQPVAGAGAAGGGAAGGGPAFAATSSVAALSGADSDAPGGAAGAGARAEAGTRAGAGRGRAAGGVRRRPARWRTWLERRPRR